LGLTLIHLPIIEMGAPELSMVEFDEFLREQVVQRLAAGENVNCHCRGGVGRAGTISACLLLKLGLVGSAKQAITSVRQKRDKRCVES